MNGTVKLPYVSRYFSGDLLNLKWLKAVTVNDNRSARRLEWHDHDETITDWICKVSPNL